MTKNITSAYDGKMGHYSGSQKVWLMGVNLDFVLVITWPWDNIQPRDKYDVVER